MRDDAQVGEHGEGAAEHAAPVRPVAFPVVQQRVEALVLDVLYALWLLQLRAVCKYKLMLMPSVRFFNVQAFSHCV